MAKPKILKNFEPGRGFSEADWDDVSDNPEWTKKDIARARPFGELFPGLAAKIRRGRGPNKAPTKQLVSLRLSPAVLKYFKDTGPGWQTRIDQTLRKAAKLPKIDASRDDGGEAPVSRVRRKAPAGRARTPAPKKRG